MQVSAATCQVENGIPDQLSGSVVGYITAAVYTDRGYGRVEDICFAAAASYGVDRRMLKEEKGLIGAAGCDIGGETLLEETGFMEIDQAEIPDIHLKGLSSSFVFAYELSHLQTSIDTGFSSTLFSSWRKRAA